MKNNNKKLTEHKLSELIMAIFNYPKTLKWMRGGLWDTIHEPSNYDAYSPSYLKMMIKEADLDNRGGEDDNEIPSRKTTIAVFRIKRLDNHNA